MADLFLDTLTYGAHSTATDALAGGLPFLTLAGTVVLHLIMVGGFIGYYPQGRRVVDADRVRIAGKLTLNSGTVVLRPSSNFACYDTVPRRRGTPFPRTNLIALRVEELFLFFALRPSNTLPLSVGITAIAAEACFLDTLLHIVCAGASFASRVGVSLLHNAGHSQSALLVAGQREYEDLAVELVSTSRGRKVLSKLRESLNEGNRGISHSSCTYDGGSVGDREGGKAGARRAQRVLPIFDTAAITEDLNRAFMAMSDAHDMWKDQDRGARTQGISRLPHIVLTGRSINGSGRDGPCILEQVSK